MPRDDFSSSTVETLAKRVGFHCSSPSCGRVTVGPHSQAGRFVKVGIGAHITAASPGGPRFDPSLTSEQRRDISNGIWLCSACGKLIDDDPAAYPVEVLRRWKSEKEAETDRNIRSGYLPNSDKLPLLVSVPTRLGFMSHARLASGEKIPLVGIISPDIDPTCYVSACVFRLLIKAKSITQETIILGVGVEVLSVESIPQCEPLMGVYPVAYNLYVINFDDPDKAGTTRFMAENLYMNRSGLQPEKLRYHPISLEKDTPEVFDFRLCPMSPGLFSIRIFASVAIDMNVEEQVLIPTLNLLVPEPLE